MNNLAQYESKRDAEFLPLLPEQEEVAERIRQEMTQNVKASLLSYEAWGKIRECS